MQVFVDGAVGEAPALTGPPELLVVLEPEVVRSVHEGPDVRPVDSHVAGRRRERLQKGVFVAVPSRVASLESYTGSRLEPGS